MHRLAVKNAISCANLALDKDMANDERQALATLAIAWTGIAREQRETVPGTGDDNDSMLASAAAARKDAP